MIYDAPHPKKTSNFRNLKSDIGKIETCKKENGRVLLDIKKKEKEKKTR